MKILFLSRRFYPDIGGVEKHILEISKRLIKEGHTVTVISEGKEDQKIRLFQERTGINMYKVDTGRIDLQKNKFIIWKWLWDNKKIIQEADIVHCHDVFYWYLPFRFLFPKKPVYTTFHGYESYPVKRKAILMRKIAEILSWGNICIGDYIQKWYGTRPTYVSYGAVEIAKGKEQKSKNVKKESAVFVGRLDEQTNILEYVKGLDLLRKHFSKFSLLVVGDGKYRKQIEKKVKVLGFKENPEKYFYLGHFAFVSRYLTTLEAMAAKKLVFCLYDNPLKADCFLLSPFKKWIVMVKNEKELSEKVLYFLKHPEEEKILTEAAYQWVKKQTWEEMTKLYKKLWTKTKG